MKSCSAILGRKGTPRTLSRMAMQLHWSAFDAFAYAVPVRWETTRSSALLTGSAVVLVLGLLAASCRELNTLRVTSTLDEPDMAADLFLPAEHPNHTIGITVRGSDGWLEGAGGPFSAAFFTMAMLANTVHNAGADAVALEAAECAAADGYCRCAAYAGEMVRCQREVPLEPCTVQSGLPALCPSSAEPLAVASTFADPAAPYRYVDLKLWPCGSRGWVPEVCSPSVSAWWTTSKVADPDPDPDPDRAARTLPLIRVDSHLVRLTHAPDPHAQVQTNIWQYRRHASMCRGSLGTCLL